MLSLALALTLAVDVPASSETRLPPGTPVHLGIALRFTHLEALEALRREQQDPRSPEFRRWLSPDEFGARFGQPPGTYAELRQWLEQQGLVTTPSKNLLYLEALGTAAQVQRALSVTLVPVPGGPPSQHTFTGRVAFPPQLAPLVLNVAGLDTTAAYHHHLNLGVPGNSLGPQDLRRFYGVAPLVSRGVLGQGQQTVVLSTALAPGQDVSVAAIEYFLRSLSDVKTPFVKHVLPNPQGDFDTQGGALEYELDVEMQSVGLLAGDGIVLEVAPSSEVFTTGVNDIVNTFPSAAAVSISLGICEQNERIRVRQSGMDEIAAMRQGVIQGTMEGQTWTAASGDVGANDCRDGRTVAVDFPSSIPEMLALGGTAIPSLAWNANHALMAWQPEVVWGDGSSGAAGGGRSTLFGVPGYQAGLGLPDAGGRSVPDVTLIAGFPGVAVSSTEPPGPVEPVFGTSVASPLSAGFFGLVASRLGCRLGDVHAALYALGAAQLDGGPAVFHDVVFGSLTVGAVPGPSAGPGFDSASGWGSLDVAALAAALPPCPPLADGGVGAPLPDDLGLYPGACSFLGCDAGECLTVPDGPSACSPRCNVNTGRGCPAHTVCNRRTIYASGVFGSCVPGCDADADCVLAPGLVCSRCAHVCVLPGLDGAHLGDACSSAADCPNGAYCETGRGFTDGYCTQPCSSGAALGTSCSCPGATACVKVGRGAQTAICVGSCGRVGQSCGRDGYVCQPQTRGDPACLPVCSVDSSSGAAVDSCPTMGTTLACDVPSGICGGPPKPADAGRPVVPVPAEPPVLGPRAKVCGCEEVTGVVPLAWAMAIALARARGRRA